jgi:PAS domain S-box-containing protein
MNSVLLENEKLLKDIENRQQSLNRLSKYLSELESQLALIFAASPDIIVFLDSKGFILKASDAITTILGYTRNDVIGQSIWSYFLDTSELEEARSYFNKLQNQKILYPDDRKKSLVTKWKAKSGQKVKLLWRFAVCDERENQTIGIASDFSYFEAYNPSI